MRHVIATVVIVLVPLAAAAADVDLAGQASVIDGDTIEIHGERIRFWGIDALDLAPRA
jgi:endonuclease YncB( thermonuclease family)